jgi:hypothetical protein
LPPVSIVTYGQVMEGILRWPRSRAREYERAHPGTRIYEGDFGEHYAWKATPDGGELTHGHTEDELLAKLAAAPGG